MNIVAAILVAQLGAGDYVTRERASAALRQMTPAAMFHLEAAEKSRDCETSRRATLILNSWYADQAETRAGNYGTPWMNENITASDDYMREARRQIGMQGPPDWKDYRLATRLLVVEMFRSRATHAEVVRVLNSLAESERAWNAEFGRRYAPAVRLEP